MNSRENIHQFLDSRILTMVGVSRNPADFSRRLMRDMMARGYEVFPVNPALKEIEGRKCYAKTYEVPPEATTAMLMNRAELLPALAKDCAVAGVKSVWLLKSTGDRATRQQAITILNENLIEVIDGLCPYLFLEDAGMPHSLHRSVARLFGMLPK